ncbi:MAG: glycosyltransferase family 39 protein [Candidatus Hydrogenedentes bacterium]|nr:glycosyltransferase family 39 protein [Candidatus Hydrogenedentota bacterium]
MPGTDAPARETCAETSNKPGIVDRRVWLALAGITALGAALRVYGLARYSLWYDEGTTMYAAGLAAESPLRLLDPGILTEPPLVPLVVYAWKSFLSAAGIELAAGTYRTDFLVRLVPCVISIAAIPMTFAVALRLAGSASIGLLAGVLVAVSPFHVFYAQELRPYSALTFFVLGALWFAINALESDRAVHWTGFVVMLALSMYSHFFTVWYIASLGLAVCVVSAIRRRISYRWVVSQLALLILIFPAVRQGLVINSVISATDSSWYPPLTLKTGLITIKTFFAGYSPRVWAYYPLFSAGALLSFMGAWSLRRRGDSMIVMVVMAIVPIVGNLAVWSMRSFSYYEHRLFIVCGVMFTIFAAGGLVSFRNRAVGVAATGLWLVLSASCLADYYAQCIHPSADHRLGVRYKVANRDVSNRIREEFRDGDVVAQFSHVTHFPLKSHYLPGKPIGTVGFSEEDRTGMIAAYPHESVWEHAGALPARIDEVAGNCERIWYVDSWWEPFQPPPWHVFYRPWLVRHGVVRFDKQYFGVRLGLFDIAAMRNGPVRIEQVVDAGSFAVPRYTDAAGSDIGQAPASDWTEDGSLVAARNTGSGEITIRNGSTNARTIEYRLFASAESIEPLSLNRNEPGSDVWQPVIHGNPAFIDVLDPIKMAAALTRGSHEAASVFADVYLSAGTYRVYAYLWQEVEPANVSRAALRFNAGPRTDGRGAEIGVITPWTAAGTAGWTWFDAGQLVSDGTAQRLTISTELPDGMEKAFADLGRIVFEQVNLGTQSHPTEPYDSGTISVMGDSPAIVPLPAGLQAEGRYDVFFRDTESGDIRFLNWYVSAGGK